MFLELHQLFASPHADDIAILASHLQADKAHVEAYTLFISALAERQLGSLEKAARTIEQLLHQLPRAATDDDRGFLEALLVDCEWELYSGLPCQPD